MFLYQVITFLALMHFYKQVPNRAVATGGKGARAQADQAGPNALFSQGAIKTSAKSHKLAAVNVGYKPSIHS